MQDRPDTSGRQPGQLIAAQRPDAEGHTIPATVQSGSAVVSSAQGVAQSIAVALSEAVFNVLTATCANCCFTCNGINTITVTANPFSCPVGLAVQLKATGNWNTGLTTDETTAASWSSSNSTVATVETSGQASPGLVSGLAPGSCTITALESNIEVFGHTCTGCPAFCPLGNRSGSSSGTVDTLVFTVASNGVPNDPNGVIAKSPFILKIQAKSPTGVVPDTSFNAQNVSFTLTNMNTTVGEAVSSSTVNFTSGETDPTVTIVQASGTSTAPSSVRTIVVGAFATGTVFFPLVYWQVTMDEEVWHNCNVTTCPDSGAYACKTSCTTGLPQGTQFVSLTDSSLCGKQNVVVVAQSATGTWSSVSSPVEDCGPSSGGGCSNPYWFNANIPVNGGCLSDALMGTLGIKHTCSTGSATVFWRFP